MSSTGELSPNPAARGGRERIRALVSGIPSHRRRNRLLVMLQAFIDDSGNDPSSPVFVLAGYVAKVEQWETFTDEWQAVLDLNEPKPLPVLKMNHAYRLNNKDSHFYGWSEQERDERLKKFVPVINRNVAHGIISVVPLEPYRRIFRDKFSLRALDRPYFLSFFGIMARIMTLAHQLKLDDSIDFIFDSQDNESKAVLMEEYERFISVAPPEILRLAQGFPKFEKDELMRPLQAADMLAWHVRRNQYEKSVGMDPTKGRSNVFLANIFQPAHDIYDLWTEERIQAAANVMKDAILKDMKDKLGPAVPMSVPDLTSWTYKV